MDRKIIITLSVISVLLLTSNIIMIYLTTKEQTTIENLIEKSPFPLLDFSRNFRKQEDFVVNLRPLREPLIDYIASISNFDISIYIEFLNTGANISLNPEMRVFPASLTKIPVAMITMKEIENGKLNKNSTYALKEEYKDAGWGELYKLPSETTMSVESLLVESLVNSDNTAHNILYANLDAEYVALFEEELGLDLLFDNKGEITAKEYAKIFRSLYTSSFLQKENSNYLLTLLTQTKYSDYLDSGIPENIIFAHKFGEKSSDGIFLDSGIVYIPRRPVLMTVLIRSRFVEKDNSTIRQEALKVMKKVSELTYKYFSEI